MSLRTTDPSAPQAACARDFQLTRVAEDFTDNPHPYYASLREHHPVHELRIGSTSAASRTGASGSAAYGTCRCASARSTVSENS